MEVQSRADVSRAVETLVAVAVGQNGNVAILAGINALENNYMLYYISGSRNGQAGDEGRRAGDKDPIELIALIIRRLSKGFYEQDFPLNCAPYLGMTQMTQFFIFAPHVLPQFFSFDSCRQKL